VYMWVVSSAKFCWKNYEVAQICALVVCSSETMSKLDGLVKG
jgi:hypothetical protein